MNPKSPVSSTVGEYFTASLNPYMSVRAAVYEIFFFLNLELFSKTFAKKGIQQHFFDFLEISRNISEILFIPFSNSSLF